MPLPATALRDARGPSGLPLVFVLGSAHGSCDAPALGAFRLFAWRRGPFVLLAGAVGQVVLTPDEPDRFVAEVRARLRGPG